MPQNNFLYFCDPFYRVICFIFLSDYITTSVMTMEQKYYPWPWAFHVLLSFLLFVV